MLKCCTSCFIEKQLFDFYKRSSSKDGRQSICKNCRKEIDKQSYIISEKRRLNIRKNSNKNKSYNKRLVNKYKSLCGCKVCREKEPAVLDLHHTDPSIKEGNPSQLISYSTEKLKAEIRKCIVLCSNCHRKVHSNLIQLPL